jgi:alanine dehydrogenase
MVPNDSKGWTATLEEIEMMNSQAILISAIQLKTKQKSYFEALPRKNYRSSFWIYKDEDGTYPAVKSLSEIAEPLRYLLRLNWWLLPNLEKDCFWNITGVPPTEVVI